MRIKTLRRSVKSFLKKGGKFPGDSFFWGDGRIHWGQFSRGNLPEGNGAIQQGRQFSCQRADYVSWYQ